MDKRHVHPHRGTGKRGRDMSCFHSGAGEDLSGSNPHTKHLTVTAVQQLAVGDSLQRFTPRFRHVPTKLNVFCANKFG